MEWKYVKPLCSEELIAEYEALVSYRLPEAFKECVRQYNGGRPANRSFDTDKSQERSLKSFLSFNKGDRETVWKTADCMSKRTLQLYVPFASDNFGNLICFDKQNDSVVFLDHESRGKETAAPDFRSFMEALYE